MSTQDPSKNVQFLKVRDWEKLQHYKDRNPPWIKLPRELIDSYEFSCLQDASKLHLILIWMLASQLNNKIPNDPEWVTKRLGVEKTVNIKELINNGFLIMEQDASTMLAERLQDACLEESRERAEERRGEKKEGGQRTIVVELPDWMPLEAWQDFKDMRCKIKKPMTHRAEQIAVGKICELRRQGHDPTVVLNQSIMNNWQDLYQPKGNGYAGTHSGNGKGDRARAAADKGLRELEESSFFRQEGS